LGHISFYPLASTQPEFTTNYSGWFLLTLGPQLLLQGDGKLEAVFALLEMPRHKASANGPPGGDTIHEPP
jgi:hypothetical protein